MGIKKSKYLNAIYLILMVWLATSCIPTTSVGVTAVASAAAMHLAESSPVASATRLTATQTPIITLNPLLPTPQVPSVIRKDFFFAGLDADCKPPCWNKLTVGKSTNEEIAAILDSGFDFSSPESTSINENPIKLEGFLSKSYQWFLEKNSSRNIYLAVLVSKDDLTLRGIYFSWYDAQYDAYLYPQRLIKKLGAPTQVLVDFRGTGVSNLAIFDVLLIYDDGVVLFTETLVPLTISHTTTSAGQQELDTVTACLGGNSWYTIPETLTTNRQLFLLEPFQNKSNTPTPVQQWALENLTLRRDFFVPAQDAFGMSLDEITRLALQDGDACIEKDVAKLMNR